MGHESRIEPWLPMTTVLLVSFRTDWLRREDTMKTAWKETGNRWAAVFSIRMDGAAGQNRTCSSTWGWKQEKFQRWGKCFLLTSPSIEHPPRPQKKARIPTKPGLVSTRALSAGSCFIDRPYCAASPQASHRGLPGPRSCDKRTIHQNPAPYRLAYKRSRATALKRTAPSSMTCENKEGGPATGPALLLQIVI